MVNDLKLQLTEEEALAMFYKLEPSTRDGKITLERIKAELTVSSNAEL
jgi:hypothetical protein